MNVSGSVLLTNVESGSTERTFELSLNAGLPQNLYSTNATWGNFDMAIGDGDEDLFVGVLSPTATGASRLYRNDSGVLTDQTATLLGSTSIANVVASAWHDMNNDGRLDLVLARQGEQSLVFFQNPSGNFGDGTGGSDPMAFGPTHGFSGMVIYDYDSDRRRDFLGLSNHAGRSPQLFQNVATTWGLEFLEVPASVGLDDVGYVHGAVAADFGGAASGLDGVPDLYLGRPTSTGKFYFSAQKFDAGSLANHYTTVRLDGTGAVNKLGIGAAVEIQAGGHTQVQHVDGGSLRGGQSGSDLTFGLGNYSGPVAATITWPDGLVQANVPLLVDQLNVISNAPVTVQNGTVTGTYKIRSIGTVDWIFTWEVDGPSDPAVDAVHFDTANISSKCMPEFATITSATPGATVKAPVPLTGGGYRHEVVWTDLTCGADCLIPFQVESGIPGQTDISDGMTVLKVAICAGF